MALTCDWWFNVKCDTTAQLYVLNERLYKYILPFTPKFPEDYSGPLVDKYLALKFKFMEEKLQKQRGQRVGSANNSTEPVAMDTSEEDLGGVASIDQTISDVGRLSVLTSQSGDKSNNNKLDDNSEEVEEVEEDLIGTTSPIPQPLPTLQESIESQAKPLVEIKSDGTSGHLNPGRYWQ